MNPDGTIAPVQLQGSYTMPTNNTPWTSAAELTNSNFTTPNQNSFEYFTQNISTAQLQTIPFPHTTPNSIPPWPNDSLAFPNTDYEIFPLPENIHGEGLGSAHTVDPCLLFHPPANVISYFPYSNHSVPPNNSDVSEAVYPTINALGFE